MYLKGGLGQFFALGRKVGKRAAAKEISMLTSPWAYPAHIFNRGTQIHIYEGPSATWQPHSFAQNQHKMLIFIDSISISTDTNAGLRHLLGGLQHHRGDELIQIHLQANWLPGGQSMFPSG